MIIQDFQFMIMIIISPIVLLLQSTQQYYLFFTQVIQIFLNFLLQNYHFKNLNNLNFMVSFNFDYFLYFFFIFIQ